MLVAHRRLKQASAAVDKLLQRQGLCLEFEYMFGTNVMASAVVPIGEEFLPDKIELDELSKLAIEEVHGVKIRLEEKPYRVVLRVGLVD